MKSVLKTFFIICVSFMCWSCTRDVESGYVVGKKFTPKHTTVVYNAALKQSMLMPHPDRWYIWVADSISVSRHCVSKELYNNVRLGQHITLKSEDN